MTAYQTLRHLFYFKLNAAYIINNAQASTIIIEDVVVSILNMEIKIQHFLKQRSLMRLLTGYFHHWHSENSEQVSA